MRDISSSDFNANSKELFKQLNWMSFETIIRFETTKFIYKSINGLVSNIKLFTFEPKRRTRSDDQKHLQISSGKLNYTQNSIFYKGVNIWNESTAISETP